jgi:regulator of sirC expression with transglutaminase-like and TPR domain
VDESERYRTLVTGRESEIPLDVGALLIAAHTHPVDVDARLEQLDELSEEAPRGDAAALARFLFKERAFAGNTVDYSDPANSYLDRVLDRRLGIPITLSVLMIEVGRRAGVALTGVGMPGHFLVGAERGRWYDPFHGGAALDLDGCRARLKVVRPDLIFRSAYLTPTGRRAILDRMLGNLQATLIARVPADAIPIVRLRLCNPDLPVAERMELAGALGALGRFDLAGAELERLAGHVDGAEVERLRAAARAFRARAN